MKTCHIFNVTIDIKNHLCEFEDTQQQIFLARFHGNPTDSILNYGDLLPLKVNQLPPGKVRFSEVLIIGVSLYCILSGYADGVYITQPVRCARCCTNHDDLCYST